jgi:predicted anti-sigma-YlaC factor YlaD
MSDDGKTEGGGLFVSCLRATELVSKSLETELSSREKFALRFHLSICTWCRRYRKQAGVIREALRQKAEADMGKGPGLPPEARERIRQSLKV